MEPAQEKRPVQSAVFTIQDGQNELARLQQQLTRLEDRFDKYFRRLDELEKSCERMQQEFDATERRIKEEHVFFQKQREARRSEHAEALKRINRNVPSRDDKKTLHVRPIKEEKADIAQASSRHSTTGTT